MRLLLRKTSLLDYPGKVAAAVFVRGCNLRCPWCHNQGLVLPGGDETGLLSPGEVLAFLKKRRPVLGGVVISGGEPCLWEGLPDFIASIKKLRFPVKLDTNGTIPAMLEKLFSREESRPDYIALDLKLAPSRYPELLPEKPTGSFPGISLGEALIHSAALIRGAGVPHEFRTLALPGDYITEKDIEALAPLADEASWHFRPFRGGNCLDPAWDNREEGEGEDRARALAEKARELGTCTMTGFTG